ncbi:hypothetical protein N0V82_008934 [Gnomoniopsis sp. IMI 355080]|nr:hypothetical protein N0V82_008934 [Gnomoniopsis sp. IMI 355080]
MSAAGHSSPPPTSAAVLEFICLFTHDLRRKQKRWQDGRLKYHTFNNRVMVYDDRGNFVGDMHWRHDWDLVEGEEVQLERGGVIVQVQELSSRCEQDLSELLEKRAKEKQHRQMQAVARTPASSTLPRTVVRPVATRSMLPEHAQIRHRSLHQVIGTPSGHHGRAIAPEESPFEQRQQAADSPDQPAVKRRKYDPPPSKSGYASALFGQALTLSATPTSSVPLVRRRQIREADPSQEDDDITTRTVQEEPRPPLRDQPKVSRHFNQPRERPIPTESAKSNALNHRDGEDDEEPVGHKKKRGLPRKQGIERWGEPAPIDVEVIDIGSPDTTPAKESLRSSRAEKKAAKQQKVHKTDDKPAAASSGYGPDTRRTTNDRVDDVFDKNLGTEKVSKIQERNERSKKSNTTQSVAKRAVAKPSAAKIDDHLEAATFPARAPTIPVTELRIKSRKKRGLMMMSDLHRRPHEQSSAASRIPCDAKKAMEIEETDYSFRSPSPLPYEKPHQRDSHPKGNLGLPRADSTELGEPEKDTSSLSLEAHRGSKSEERGRHSKQPARNASSIQLGEDDQFPPPTSPRPQDGSARKNDDRTVIQRKISKELGVEDDSSRLASSPPALSARLPRTREAGDPADDMNFMTSNQGDDFRDAFQLDIEGPTVKLVDDAVNMVHTGSPQEKDSDPYRLPSSSPEEQLELPARVASSVVVRAPRKADQRRRLNSEDVPDERQSADDAKGTNKVGQPAKRPRAFLRNVVLDESDELDAPSAAPEWVEGSVDEPLDIDFDNNLKPLTKQHKSKQSTKEKSKDLEAPDQDEIGSDSGEVLPKKQAKSRQARTATKRKSLVQEQDFDVESEDEQPVKRRMATRKLRNRATEPEAAPLPSEQEDSEEEPSSRGSRKKMNPKISKGRPRLEKIKNSVKSRELIGFNLSATKAPLGFRGIGMPFGILSSPATESIPRRTECHAAIEPSSDSLLASIHEQMPVATSDVLQMMVEADEMAVDTRLPKGGCNAQLPETASTSLIPEDHMPGNGVEVSEDPARTEIPQSEYRDSPRVGSATATKRTEPASPYYERQTSATSGVIQLAPEQSEDVAEPAADEAMISATKVSTVIPVIPPSMKSIAAKQHQNTSNVFASKLHEVSKENEIEALIEAGPAALPSLPACRAPEPNPVPALQMQSFNTANADTEQRRPEQVEVSAEKPPSAAVRRQTPNFKPPTKVKVNTAQSDNESNLQCDRPGVKDVEIESNQVPPTKLTRALSRSSSGLVDTAKAQTAKPGLDVKEGARADQEHTLPAERHHRVGLHRTVSATRRINNITIEPLQPAISNDPTPAGSSTKSAPNARIANPASRGRKAAVKADAKGPVPQRMLPPTQPFAMVPISTADFSLTPIEEPPKEPERPKKKMTFPGFQSAKGEGPWSREAFDLLESGRPG